MSMRRSQGKASDGSSIVNRNCIQRSKKNTLRVNEWAWPISHEGCFLEQLSPRAAAYRASLEVYTKRLLPPVASETRLFLPFPLELVLLLSDIATPRATIPHS